ncbi:MAG: glycosyltransferase family 4 protein [Flavisolibacter sp.]|nr:glycosyltransferase family 4 protein [Flavisolibacter sp.]
MQKIKMFVDAHCFDTEFQGTQTFVRELYTALLKKYNDLDIYFGAKNKKNLLENFPSLDADKVLPYKYTRPSFIRLVSDIPRHITRTGIHFAHFQNIAPVLPVPCKSIVTLHDVLFLDYKNEFPSSFCKTRAILFGRSFKKATIKTTVSSYSLERISHHYNILPSNIHVVPNAAEHCKRDGFPFKKNAADYIQKKFNLHNFILCVSRMEPRKDHELLLDAYLNLNLYKQNISLVFIGKKSIKNKSFEQKLQELPEEARKMVVHLEQVSQADLSAFYSSCLFFVYPSKAEGFGIPPLEAALCGAPVICSNSTAMRDFDFFEPFLFTSGNAVELKQKMLLMLQQPHLPNEQDSITRKIVNRFSWEKSADTFYQLLKRHSLPCV